MVRLLAGNVYVSVFKRSLRSLADRDNPVGVWRNVVNTSTDESVLVSVWTRLDCS